MVLADLGSKVAIALRKMTQATVIDQTVMNEMLTEICKALLQADVNVAQERLPLRACPLLPSARGWPLTRHASWRR
jgi:Signal recognition particle GTPase